MQQPGSPMLWNHPKVPAPQFSPGTPSGSLLPLPRARIFCTAQSVLDASSLLCYPVGLFWDLFPNKQFISKSCLRTFLGGYPAKGRNTPSRTVFLLCSSATSTWPVWLEVLVMSMGQDTQYLFLFPTHEYRAGVREGPLWTVWGNLVGFAFVMHYCLRQDLTVSTCWHASNSNDTMPGAEGLITSLCLVQGNMPAIFSPLTPLLCNGSPRLHQ